MKKGFLFLMACFIIVVSNATDSWKDRPGDVSFIHRAVKKMTDVMVHDIYSPPVASRIYAYICIAGYEAALPGYASHQSLAGQLHGLKNIPKPAPGLDYSPALAAAEAILTVGRTMVISEQEITAFNETILKEFKASGMPDEVYAASVAYGQVVAAHITAWAALDNYKQTRSFGGYSPSSNAASWKPTPPAYIKAVEPHWNQIRTLIMDSAQQFKPKRPTPFSTDTASQFYKEALAVRDAGTNITPEQRHIANFWDCNPFKMNVNGHVMYASKKISPGGHWMNITRVACEKSGADVINTLEAYTSLAITIADAFISCWDEKYRTLVIRPETYINQYIDADWMPLLQTPPFPEYTSGHSVLSAASAVVLTKLFGDHFSYTDSTENEFDVPERHFTSFKQAAEEAAISRFYGGIHYMPSIVNGFEEGTRIGEFMMRKLKTRTNNSAKR